jgi:phage/plasmid-associated DNA primase
MDKHTGVSIGCNEGTDDGVMVISDHRNVNHIIQSKISKNIRNLTSFLQDGNFTTEKRDQNTNIIDVAEKKTYNINSDYIGDFFTVLDACRQENRLLHFSERQETAIVSQSGIMIDFDYLQSTREPKITIRHIDAVCTRIAKILIQLLEFGEYAKFKVFVIKKSEVAPYDSKAHGHVFKDGFHILIPELQVTKGFKRYLNQEIVNRKVISTVFSDIEHLDDVNLMLDKLSASNPVHFYGNSKPDKPPYKLTRVYEYTYDACVDDTGVTCECITVDDLLECKGVYKDLNLTYELSLSFTLQECNKRPTWLQKKQYKYKTNLEIPIQLLLEKTSRGILQAEEILEADNSVDILAMCNAEVKYLKQLLEIIDISYATEYDKWFKVICAIAHTGHSYKPLAVWFSHRKPEAWSADEIGRVWDEATSAKYARKPVTKRSLMYWARISSPERYKDINHNNYVQILARGLYDNEGRVEHSVVAQTLHAMIGDKFIVDSGYDDRLRNIGSCWFEFVLPGQAMKKGEIYKWRKEITPDNVHLFISNHLPKVYSQLAKDVKTKRENAKDQEEAAYWTQVERTFRIYKSKLCNNGFQNGIILQAQYMFRQRGFIDQLDKDDNIIGVGNGVLVIGRNPVLIQGFHEYRISKYTEVDYLPYNPQCIYTQTLLNAFKDIFPEKDVFEFMMYHAALGLDSRESACMLLLLVGGGRNGKSFYAKMIHNTLGNSYCGSGKPGLLTSVHEKAGDANSAQMQMKDKRYFYFDEFNKSEVLNMARVKSIVSPGWQSGRDLYATQSNFINTCNPIALSNFDFIIDTTDHGTWRRIYYYKNKVRFCENPTAGNPYEKKVNDKFILEYTNKTEYKQAMLSILAHYYSKLWELYDGDIKKVPVPTMVYEQEEFRNRQDSLNKFITTLIVCSPNAAPISQDTLAARYIEWYMHNVRRCAMTLTDVHSQFENSRLSEYLIHDAANIKYLHGHRLKPAVEDPLRPGESLIHSRVNTQVAMAEIVEKQQVIEKPQVVEKLQTIDFVEDLTNNAPMYIQNITNEEDPTLLEELERVLL